MNDLVVRLAPAKVNLTLAVVGPRSDGFHDLHSVFVPLALADRLSLAPVGPGGPGGRTDSLHVDGGDTGPAADNLVVRAIAAARALVGVGPGRPATPALAARLEKRIPVAAGLGGGSSDGAAALLGALEAWGAADVDQGRVATAAAALGSDVPFFLVGRPALVEGRGERVRPLTGIRGTAAILLVTPRVAIRTPDVFAVFAGTAGHGDGSVRMASEHLAAELGTGLTVAGLVTRAGVLAAANDLLAAALIVEPGLRDVRRAVARVLGRPIGLSGSGPTLWTLYPSLMDADTAAGLVRDAVARGTIPTIGDGPPSVIATTIVSPQEEPAP